MCDVFEERRRLRGARGFAACAVVAVSAAFARAQAPAPVPAAPVPAAPTPAAPKLAAGPDVSRADLAVSYLRLERTLRAFPPGADAWKRVNERFDQATLAFFFGNAGAAIQELDALHCELTEPRASRLACSLRARFDPPLGRATAEPGPATQALDLRVRLEVLYAPAADEAHAQKLELHFDAPHAEGGDAARSAGANALAGSGSVLVEPAWNPAEPAREFVFHVAAPRPGAYTLTAQLGDAPPVRVGAWFASAESLDALRERNAARLAALEPDGPPLAAALAACSARNALLTDTPSTKSSAQFLADPLELAANVGAELSQLAAGVDPYRRRAGDLWRTVETPRGALPVRVFAPPQACGDARVPLVLALHGMGGDENMFFAGYGAGAIVELARTHGFVVAAPELGFAGLAPEAFDALVLALVYDYAIDPARVYVLGHSMGAGAASALAASRCTRIAAVVCFAGGSVPAGGELAPLKLWAGELDPLARAPGLVALAEKARARGAPVECEVVANTGHTLVVGARLAAAVEWLLAHTLVASGAKK